MPRLFEKIKGKSYSESLEIHLTHAFNLLVTLESKKGKVKKEEVTDVRRYVGNCMTAENLKMGIKT
jgi:hypothetical protein